LQGIVGGRRRKLEMGEERSENDQTMGGKFTVQALA
jgi:hypothetical protein